MLKESAKKRLDAKKPLGKRTIAFPAVFYVSKTIKLRIPQVSGALEAPPRFELGVKDLQSSALPLGYSAIIGADDEARTRYLHLGKVALYQMSYIRKIKWCLRTESNHRHEDFQSSALPTELQRQKMATRNGLEPSTSSVTG